MFLEMFFFLFFFNRLILSLVIISRKVKARSEYVEFDTKQK